MALTRRERITTYLVVTLFAVVLAFPFYWMAHDGLQADR